MRVRPSPRKKILEVITTFKGVTRSEVAEALGINYWSSRYWLERLVEESFLRKEIVWTIRGFVRRIFYFKVVPKVYFRTQFAMLFYTEKPRTKTPDPIAEFRVTAVSNRPKQYDLKELERACIYVGVILAPQTYWIKQKVMITADELDEAVDVDELEYSVPVYKRLNFAERYAVFFKSRQGTEEYWREDNPYYWLDPTKALPLPREGDYEYAEDFIKSIERKKIVLGALNMKFNNERGEMESVI